MKRPRPIYRQALHLAARNRTLTRSNDHLRMALSAALRGETVVLARVRELESEHAEVSGG